MSNAAASVRAGGTISRSQIEDFLYREAELLDDWRLDEWLELLTDDARYLVPSLDLLPDDDPAATLYLIADDSTRIRSRVKQLMGKSARAEQPRSRTRRIISNVRIVDETEASVRVTANFLVHRSRIRKVDTFIGKYEYRLLRDGGHLKIEERKAILDLDALQPHGVLSIIL